MSAVRHVIFDLDGTLVDSLPGIAFSVDAALRACGLPPVKRDLAALMGPPVRDILAAVSGGADRHMLDRLERSFRASYDAEGWRRTVCLAGVPDMLWRLMTGGAALWIATNKPSFPTGRILRELNLAALFREAVCRDSRIPPYASKAELLFDLVERHDLDREACLMVGDTAEDWHAAEAAEIPCAIVGPGNGPCALPRDCCRIGGWDELEEMVHLDGVRV
jgi:phosphoglycolate phosphatase